MSLSAFGEKAIMPNEDMIAAVLGDGYSLWREVMERINAAHPPVSEEWKFYSKSAGWSLVVKSGKRTLAVLIPQEGFFKMNFTLGEKAVHEAMVSSIPEAIVTLISEAKQYMEGRPFLIDVKTEEDKNIAILLLRIKAEN